MAKTALKPVEKMEKPIKILAFSDIHGDLSLVKELRQKAVNENVDLILICGDFSLPREEIPRGLIGSFASLKKPILLVRGNHESESTAEFLSDLYGITHLEGKGFLHYRVGVFGCSGANLGLFSLDEEEIFSRFKEGHATIANAQTRIMISHVHPSESQMEEKFFPGSSGVRHAIRTFKPDIAICGHIHEAEGMEEIIDGTRVVNVSKHGKIFEV